MRKFLPALKSFKLFKTFLAVKSLTNRFKNYGFWLSLLALVPMVCKVFDVQIPESEYDTLVNSLLTFLVAAGIVSNPTTSNKWYVDDTKSEEE